MSEFQASLLVVGALAIAGVFAFNKWQEHRAAQTADETFRSRHPDVLDGKAPESSHSGGRATSDSRIEPVLDPGHAPEGAHGAIRGGDNRSGEFAPAPMPNPRIDYVIELDAAVPLNVASTAELWGDIAHRFSRQASLACWIDGQWAPLTPTGACRKLQAALQLVSRRGVISESELLEFRSAIETFAARLALTARAAEMRDALEAARVLDGICAEADIQVAFHVVAASGSVFAGTKVRASAEAAGFVLDPRGRFTLMDEAGRELYELGDRNGAKFTPATMKDAAPEALTLSMDVPRAPDTQRTFDSMVRFARQLASLLGGSLVDDNNQPLDERSIAAINSQLALVRQSLDAQGIAPGSALAQRLFS